MKSPYTYFIDEFRLRIFLRLGSAPGAYQRFREDILPRVSSSSLHHWSEYFLNAWRLQIPAHQEQYLQLKTAHVPFEYYEFLINQFDDWFAHHHQDAASGNPGSFFCLQNYLTTIQWFRYLFFCSKMILVISVFLLLLLVLFFFPGSYPSELMISFLPYLLGALIGIVIISFVYFRKTMRPGYSCIAMRYVRGMLFLAFCTIFFLLSKRFNSFYLTAPFPEYHTGELTILFANIHKDNTRYAELEQLILQKDPDLLMFVEFSDHHYAAIKDLLKTHYPYTNNISRSKTFIGSMVFSKYPITNKADDFPQGAWRYGYFSIPYHGEELYLYLVHTSSPDRYDHFLMRNQQLQTFVKDFKFHESDRKHQHIIVVGDFNVTPWSSYYQILTDAFSGSLENVTRRIPFLFTWRLFLLPFVQAHIDHLWITSSLSVSSLEVLKIPGSDHKGFLFRLRL